LAAVVVVLLVWAPAPLARGSSQPQIDHVVVVVLENATLDSMFGTYPGVDGLDRQRDRVPDLRGVLHGPRPLRITDLGRSGSFPLAPGEEAINNGFGAATDAYRGGKMDGFIRAQEERDFQAPLVMRHFDRRTVPGLWQLADEYVLFDRYFSSARADSLPNILHLISGSDQGVKHGTRPVLRRLWTSTFPTIFDRAEDAGISWRYYVGGLDRVDARTLRRGGYFTESSPFTPSQLYWAPVLSIGRFWERPLRRGIADQGAFFRDALRGKLPAISYVLPSPNTHWPTLPWESERRLYSILNAVRRSPQWERTAIFLVWDDWGGFYDHVDPPTIDGHPLGFRVPAMLISPAAARGHISSETHDHTSIPAFIADTFGLKRVGQTYTSPSFNDAWGDSIRPDPIFVLRRPAAYEARGREHATSVFRLYLFGLLVAAVGIRLLWVRMSLTETESAHR
jgi:phospholipase C